MSAPAVQTGTVYDYGVLPLDVFPAFYPKCWCSSVGQFDCSEPWHFRAFSGQLRVLCPPGYYEVESQEGPAVCRLCQKSYYCTGGTDPKRKCRTGQTTETTGSVSKDDCYCNRGYS